MNKNKFLKITNTLIINFSEIRINSSNNHNNIKINNIIRHWKIKIQDNIGISKAINILKLGIYNRQ